MSLVVVLDVNPTVPLPLTHILAFLNAHLATPSNHLAVFAAAPPSTSKLLYASADPVRLSHTPPDVFPPFHALDHLIANAIPDLLATIPAAPPAASPVVAALTKALCYINRLAVANTAAEDSQDHQSPRILILSVSPDLTSAYIPIMNAIFSAQKLNVTIDACQITAPDSVFLQQAAHLTAGSYVRLDRPDALLQYLMMAFLPPPSIRKFIAVPTQEKVDFRAACFCHKNIVDIAFVCSVCLSIFCQPVPVCSTCRTKFPIKTLQRLNASRAPTPRTPVPPASRRLPAETTSGTNGIHTNPTNGT